MSHQFAPNPQDRRRHPRLEHNIPVKISSEDADIVTETKNLSCSGAFCRMSQRLEPMTKLRIYLLLPVRKNNKMATKKIVCQGVVVRSQAVEQGQYYDTAIFFSDITAKDSQTIGEFVDSLMDEKNLGQYN